MKTYIAYGSNMDEEQMAVRCPGARLLGKGVLKDYRLMFKGSKTGSYATIEPEQGSAVPILYWQITASDERMLDRYEGCPDFYYKTEVSFKTEKGRSRKGMVYIMHEHRSLGCPSVHYYGILADAYDKFGFDISILEEALRYSIRPSD